MQNSNYDFKDKVILITGGNSGTGRSSAIELAKYGAKIAITGRRESRNQEVVDKIVKDGGDAIQVPCDIGFADQVQNMVDAVVGKYGKIDVLINNAGVSQWESFLEMTPEACERIIRTNLMSLFFSTQACYRVMLKQGHGHVINVTSVAAYWPEKMEFAYGVSKSGAVKFSAHLATEFNENANAGKKPWSFFVHCLLPSGMSTEFWGNDKPFRNPDDLLNPDLFAELIPALIANPGKGLEFFEEMYKDHPLHLHIFDYLKDYPFMMCVGKKQ